MQQANITVRNSLALLLLVIVVIWLLQIGSFVFIPLIFAGLFSIALNPILKFYLPYCPWDWMAIAATFLSIIGPLVIIGILFYFQLVDIVENMPSLKESIDQGINSLNDKVSSAIPGFSSPLGDSGMSGLLDAPMDFISTGLSRTTTTIASIGLTIVFTFFFMYYRKALKAFLYQQFDRGARSDVKEVVEEIKTTIQKYLAGLSIVIGILAVCNTLGLLLIGIDYAVFWGVLGALLAIVPYAGTWLGALLPFLYALTTGDYSWQPWAVLGYYVLIQQIEGNFITPNIIGDQVDLNPMVAILSLVSFGLLFGVSGVILALPLMSILRICLENFESTQEWGYLMGSKLKDFRDFSSKDITSSS